METGAVAFDEGLLERLKNYTKILEPEQEDLLRYTYLAAVDYLNEAGVIQPEEQAGSRFELAAFGLTLHWLDNRDAVSPDTVRETPLGLRPLINQLKASSQVLRSAGSVPAVSESDTAGG